MRNGWKICLTGFAVFVLAGCSSMPDFSLPGSDQFDSTHYEATQEIVLADILSPPPAAGSDADKADFDAVLKAQKTRTPKQVEQAKQDAELSVFRFEPALGKKFTPENLPVTAAFFANVKEDEEKVVHAAKDHYDRPRPYALSEDVHPVVDQPNNSSYPSGHATFAYVVADLLAGMIPEKHAEIFKRADQFAHNRVIVGVHYPSDVAAGETAGSVIAGDLMQDDKFREEFAAARKELRKELLGK